jgi:hypothetical protein
MSNKKDNDYEIMDLNFKAGIAFTVVSLAIVLLIIILVNTSK